MSNNFTYTRAGGRIVCRQCESTSRRTKERCKAPAFFDGARAWCKFHGGASTTGSKAPEGRQRCAEAKNIHGNETRKARTERALAMRRLRTLENLGHTLGIMQGTRTRGRKSVPLWRFTLNAGQSASKGMGFV